jgi:hypothetical protein
LPTDGFDEGVTKYGWPGTISQSVFYALWGEWLPDPLGVGMNVHAFNPHTKECSVGGTVQLKAPLVVKPPPEQDASVRARLNQLADEMMNPAYKGHYPFYSYTDATIALDPAKRPGPGLSAPSAWAEGTIPVVCSTVIWAAAQRLKQAGVPIDLEGGALETKDSITDRKQLGSMDGLYYYTAEERLDAGKVFHDKVYDRAYEKAGWEGNLAFDLSDDLADQTTMCFAFDKCSPDDKDSNDWEDPDVVTPGDSVSPDDLIQWDGPDDSPNGVYGYNERMVYVVAQYRRAYEWAKVEGTASVYGTVTYQGAAEDKALVTLGSPTLSEDSLLQTLTDAVGYYRIDNVPVLAGGTLYPISAAKMKTDDTVPPAEFLYVTGFTEATLMPDTSTQLDIELTGGNPEYRVVRIPGHVSITDDDTGDPNCLWEDCNEYLDRDFIFEDMDLRRAQPTYSFGKSWCCDDEIKGRIEGSLELVTPEAVAAGALPESGVPVTADQLWSLYYDVTYRMWNDGCDSNERPPANQVGWAPAETTTSLFPVIITGSDFPPSWVTFSELQIENMTMQGSAPIPEPGPGEPADAEPWRRRITVQGLADVVDVETFSATNPMLRAVPIQIQVEVDPWNRSRATR